jgi:hypothetical protein
MEIFHAECERFFQCVVSLAQCDAMNHVGESHDIWFQTLVAGPIQGLHFIEDAFSFVSHFGITGL